MNPKSHLIEFLSSFPELAPADVQGIAEIIPVEWYPKGTVLIEEGVIPQQCYYVLKGLVREYYWRDGTEVTTEFYSESYGAISSVHYEKQTQSDRTWVCVENCLLISGNAEIDAQNLAKFPILKTITHRMMEENLYATRNKLQEVTSMRPEERYLQLLKDRPGLFQRVPLHQVASYLGITPESLSRIRKRAFSRS